MSNPEKFTAIKVEWDYMMLNQIGSPTPTKVKTNPKKLQLAAKHAESYLRLMPAGS